MDFASIAWIKYVTYETEKSLKYYSLFVMKSSPLKGKSTS